MTQVELTKDELQRIRQGLYKVYNNVSWKKGTEINEIRGLIAKIEKAIED